MVDHRVTRSDFAVGRVVGLGGSARPDQMVDAVPAVPDGNGPPPGAGRAVGAGTVECRRMVHDDVSRLDREAHEAGVVVRDLRDGRPFGPGEGLIGHEPVRAVDQT